MIRILIGAAIGAGLGYLYYRFIGCATGSCPITKNPYTSMIYGMVIGILLSIR